MSTTYTGNPANNPASITIPSDGQGAIKAADVNTAFEGLADQIAHANATIAAESNARALAIAAEQAWTRLLPVLNFSQDVSGVFAGSLRGAGYCKASQEWYVVGAAGSAHSSLTNGWTWSSNHLSAVAAGTESCASIDFSDAGEIAVACDKRTVFTKKAGVWAAVAVAGGGVINGNTDSQISYDPVSGLWFWLSADGVGGLLALSSPDLVTWTSRSAALAPFTYDAANLYRTAVDRAHGVTVATYVSSADGDVKVARSADGGVTWTIGAPIAHGLSADPTNASLVYDEGSLTWIYSAGRGASSEASVFTSQDGGVTWTRVALLADHALGAIAALGVTGASLFATASRTSTQVAYSLDGGASWKQAQFTPGGIVVGLFSSGSGFLYVTQVSVYPGLRTGTSGAALT